MTGIKVLYLLIPISLLFDSTIISFPFLFFLSLILFVLREKEMVGFFIFLTGLLHDALRVDTLGVTPIFIFSSLLFLKLVTGMTTFKHQRFIFLLSLILTFLYGRFLSYPASPLIYAVLAILIFVFRK